MDNSKELGVCAEFKQACDDYTKSTQEYYNEVSQAFAEYSKVVEQATARWTKAHETVLKSLQKSTCR